MVKKVSTKRPKAARYALAKRVDQLSKAVKANTRARYGELQMSNQVLSNGVVPIASHPLVFCLDEFHVARHPVTATAGNSASVYQLNTLGTLTSAAHFQNYNHDGSIIAAQYDGWLGLRADTQDSGKYLATSASYTFRLVANPSLDDTRVQLTFFRLKKTNYQNRPQMTLEMMLQSGKHLLNGNRLSPTIYNILFTKSFYFNNTASTTVRGTGPRSRRWSHYFKMNKLVKQNVTQPASQGTVTPDGAWKVETGQRDVYSPIYCMINCDDQTAVPPSDKIQIDITRVVRWKDPEGSAF